MHCIPYAIHFESRMTALASEDERSTVLSELS
jgi:hypothetical protein